MRGEIYFVGGITLLYCCDTVIKLIRFVTRHSRFDMQAQVVSGLVVLGMALMGVATNDLGRYVGLLFTLTGLAWLLADLRHRGKLDKWWEWLHVSGIVLFILGGIYCAGRIFLYLVR